MAISTPERIVQTGVRLDGALARRPARVLLAPLAARARAALSEALRRETARGTGVVALAGLFVGGAAIHFSMPAEPSPWVVALGVVCALVAWLTARHGGGARMVAAASLALLLGMGSGGLETSRKGTTMLGSSVTTKVAPGASAS